jgi:AAA15 family ATPase/GTPase
LKAHLLGFLKQADFNITDVKTDIVKEAIPEQYLNSFLNDETLPASEKDRMRKEKTLARYDTLFEHTVTIQDKMSKFYLPKDLESLGTRRTFGIETAIYYAQQNNAFLAIDEVENSLHPKLLRFILLDFLRKNSRSQLMVTTHYDPLLNDISKQNDQRIFRKDSVWFTEKLDSGHTDVYSLAEFRGLNRLSSIQKAYNQGNFGAIPQIDL